MEQAPLRRTDDPDLNLFNENTDEYTNNEYTDEYTSEYTNEYRAAPYALARTDIDSEQSVPLFISDSEGEPYPEEYITPRIKKRSSISAKILAVACAASAAAILVALVSSDDARNILLNVKAAMAAGYPAPSVAAQPDPSQLTARQMQKARLSAAEGQTPGVGGVATTGGAPAREEIKLAYQNALQGRVMAAAPAVEPAPPEPAIHQLDPDAIAALLTRADALIASGDVAAARLVLRRAADAQDARAAMTLAETYDPVFLEKLGVRGFVPDLAMARSWYEKARILGSAEAPRRLETLASGRP
jgi:hypothetical protein